jgi:hypothetical protein
MTDYPDTNPRRSSRRELVVVPQHGGTVPLWAMALAAGATLAIGSAALYSAVRGASRYRQHTYRRANEELQPFASEMRSTSGRLAESSLQLNRPLAMKSAISGTGALAYRSRTQGSEPVYARSPLV